MDKFSLVIFTLVVAVIISITVSFISMNNIQIETNKARIYAIHGCKDNEDG